jgi:RNA polymerase sigma-70 factor (ECF subfamily)
MKTLIERMTRGDQAALGEFYDKTSGLVFGLCQRIVRDPAAAEEITLDVFMQAWNQAAVYDASRGTPEAWLLVIARSRALDHLRSARTSKARQVESIDEICSEPAAVADVTAGAAATDRRRIVSQALERVSKEEREVLGYAFFSGMSHSEISSHLKQPLGTVKSRIRSGLTKLRRTLAPYVMSGIGSDAAGAAGGVAW